MRQACHQAWRTARSSSGRFFSDAAGGGRVNPLNVESPTASKLFENVRLPEAEATAGAAAEAAGAPIDVLESTAVGRTLSALGNALFFGGVAAASFFGYYTYHYEAGQVETMVEETRKPENSFPGSSLWVPVMEWYVEKRKALEGELKKYADPPNDRLLPDLPPHARGIKTLVLDLDDVLVHSDWTRGRGWRTFKRPGAEDFVKALTPFYELVVYTRQLPTYADPILDRLDPQRYIQYRLYRDSTQYVHGKHVRDLSKLNRDMGQVLLITADPDAYALQPENAIKLPKWDAKQAGDTTLLDLLPFLEAVVTTHVPDVRDVVRSYEGQHIPTAFRERMRRVQEQQKTHRSFLGTAAARGGASG